MKSGNQVVKNVLISRGVAVDVKFIDERRSNDRVIAKCKGHNPIVVTLDRSNGFFIAIHDKAQVGKSRRPDQAFRRAVRKTWRLEA